MFWIILISTLSLVPIIWKYYLKPFKLWKNIGVPQINPLIFLGDTWPIVFRLKNLPEWSDWIYYKYPKSKYVGIYQFTTPVLVLRDPELIKQMAVRDFDHFTDHTNFVVPEEIDPLMSKNLVSLKGQTWKDMRASLSGSFTSSKMRTMYELILEESVKFVKHFKNKNEQTIEVEMKDAFTRFTNDAIASVSFGIKVDSLANPDNEFLQMGKEVTNFNSLSFVLKFFGLSVCPWFLKLFGMRIITKKSYDFFTSIIMETIKVREEQKIIRRDMIDSLLEVKNRKSAKAVEENDLTLDTGFAVIREAETVKPKRHVDITNMDIAAQAMLFYQAGFDTVSTVMCFACYELAINPEIQDKLREEIQETYERSKGKPSYEDLLGMKYLDMVITESLRKWPAASVADRLCVKPYSLEASEPGESKIEFQPGFSIWIPLWSIHRDPKYYPTPEKFIPERFSEENKGNLTPFTYFPFGVGPRACIATRLALLEVKSVLFHLLNSFAVVPTEKTKISPRICKTLFNIFPEGGFPLGLKRI